MPFTTAGARGRVRAYGLLVAIGKRNHEEGEATESRMRREIGERFRQTWKQSQKGNKEHMFTLGRPDKFRACSVWPKGRAVGRLAER